MAGDSSRTREVKWPRSWSGGMSRKVEDRVSTDPKPRDKISDDSSYDPFSLSSLLREFRQVVVSTSGPEPYGSGRPLWFREGCLRGVWGGVRGPRRLGPGLRAPWSSGPTPSGAGQIQKHQSTHWLTFFCSNFSIVNVALI